MRRYSEAVKADVRKRMSPPQRQSVAQISAAGHSRGHPLQLEDGLAIRGAGGSCLSEGSRGLGAGRQIHGGHRNRRLEHDGIERLLPGEGSVSRAGGPLAPGRPGCECRAAADHGRAEEPGEAPPGRSAGNQTAAAGAPP